MSLLQRIPPLVSALAFGYGAGMAAPQATISSMQAAVAAYQGERPATSAPLVASTLAAPGAFGQPLGGSESGELARLREGGERREGPGGASCSLDRPMYSAPRAFQSKRDTDDDDSDELDLAGTDALSRLQLPDLRMPISKRTLKYVRFFARTDRGRGMFESWLKRSGRYQEMVQAELRDRQLPEDLIWVAMIESGFDARARSPAGAVGLWQFMPATGAVYGLAQTAELDQRKNPKLATQAAAHHLHDLYMRFGSWDLALAAYNMGYEQLLDAIDRVGTTDFNELARQQAIPSETASYVPKIAAAAILANNLEHFGFDRVKVPPPVDAAEIAVPPRTPLKTLARAAGVSTSQIRAMNPDVLGERVPPGRGDFLLLVPADSLARAQASLPAMMDMKGGGDDSDASVLDPVDLLGGSDRPVRARGARDDDSLLSLLPPPRRSRSTLRHVLGDDALESADADDDDPLPTARRTSLNRAARRTLYYRVGPGDSLLGVARQFAADVEDVARDNSLDVDAKLRAGSILKLRVRSDVVKMSDKGGDAEPAKDAAREAPATKSRAGDDADPPARKGDPDDKKRDRGAKATTKRHGRTPA